MGLPFADIRLLYILAAIGVLALGGPSFVMGASGKHKTALQAILMPGAVVFIGLALYFGDSTATAGLLVALAAAGVALVGWTLGAAFWEWRRWRSARKGR